LAHVPIFGTMYCTVWPQLFTPTSLPLRFFLVFMAVIYFILGEISFRSPQMLVPDKTPNSGDDSRSAWQRFLSFIEQPLFLGVFSVVGGLVGVVLYTPVFLVCDACVLLALHRSKAVEDKSTTIKIIWYAVTFLVTSAILMGAGLLLRNSATVVRNIAVAIAESMKPAEKTINGITQGSNVAAPPPVPPEKPDLIAEFADENDVHMIISNVHGVTAHTPKFTTILVDIDDGADVVNGKFHRLLPLPGQTDDFLMGHSSFFMLPLLHYQVPNALPPAHRTFGFITLSCADCQQMRRYWIYFQSGTGGWYAELKRPPKPAEQIIMSHLNPQDLSSLNQVVSLSRRHKIIAVDDVVVKYQQQGTFR
jgi:hypothetical protein